MMRILLFIVLMIAGCNRSELTALQANDLVKQQVGFDARARGWSSRHHYFPGREWTFYMIGNHPNTESTIPPDIQHLNPLSKDNENHALACLEMAINALDAQPEIAMLRVPETHLLEGRSLTGEAFVYVAINRRKAWFVMCILRS